MGYKVRVTVYNPNTWKVVAGGSGVKNQPSAKQQVPGQSGIHETLSPKAKENAHYRSS